MTATSIPTNEELYQLAEMYVPLDVYDRLKKQSYRDADSRHTSHRVILPGLLLAALRQLGILPTTSNAAV